MNAPRLKSGTPDKLRVRQIIAGLTLGGLMALGTGVAKAAVVFADNFNSEVPPVALPGTAVGPFGTEYPFVPSSSFGPVPAPGTVTGALVSEELMAFVPNSAVVHGLWADFGGNSFLKTTYTPEADHSGLFLAVNGSTAPGQIVYQRAGIVVAPNSTNDFQADLVSLFSGEVANLQFSIDFYAADNSPVGGSFAVGNSPTNVAQWGTVVLPSIVAPAGTATATITLRNSATAANGNDFGVDNIILSSTPQNPPPPPPPPVTCVGTGTLGYWKTHPAAWPVQNITIGGVVYSKADAITKMSTSPAGDKTYTMFQQLVAAKLNVLMGNADACISSTIAAADAWLSLYPLGSRVRGSSAAWGVGGPWATKLDDYNNGRLCAPHRDSLNCN